MTDTTAPRALIIGGSLGGLFTTLTLRAIGWRVDVFERSRHALDSRGGGIVLQPDVLHAFHFAGLRHPGALGVASGDRIFLDRDGKVVQRGYQPQTQISWNMLHTLMRAALPDAQVHPGETLPRFEQAGGQVRAHFAGGRGETGDLLVGADGARSAATTARCWTACSPSNRARTTCSSNTWCRARTARSRPARGAGTGSGTASWRRSACPA